jgi:flagellar hook-length control protein FliK
MPRAIETLLPPAPIRKAAPVAPKPADAPPASERSEDFKQALESAGKKAAQNAKPEEKPVAKTDPKKTTGKPQTKAIAKGTKPKPASPNDDDAADAVDETAPEEVAQNLPVEAQAASEATQAEAPKPDVKEVKDQGSDADVDHPAPDAAAIGLAASQLVQPVDQPKDQPQKPKPGKDNPGKSVAEKDVQSIAAAAPDHVAEPPTATAVANAPTPTAAKATRSTAEALPTQQTTPVASAATSQPAVFTQPEENGQQPDDAPTAPAAAAVNAQQPSPKPVERPPIRSNLDIPQDPALQAPIKATAPKPSAPADTDTATAAVSAISDLNLPDPSTSDTKHTDASADLADLTLDAAGRIAPDPAPAHLAQPAQFAAPAAAPAPSPEIEFAQANHDKIVSGVQSQLLPHGGAMQIRLDPPELGALKVMVEMRDGVMNATFQTSNEQATQLLSHSLNQLKHVLESQGVTVERLQVQQAPKSEQSSSDERQQQQQQQRDANEHHTAQQEQQRKEMLRRMWRKVSGAGDPIDYIA